MTTDHTLARLAGGLYLLTFATSIPALALKTGFLAGEPAGPALTTAVLLELLLAFACIGTAVTLFPVLRSHSPMLALGFVASRIIEGALVLLGVVALLAAAPLRDAGTASADPAVQALLGIHDQAFLLGPGLLPAVNAALLAPALLRAGLAPPAIPLTGLIGAPLLLASAVATLLGLIDQVSPLAGAAALPIAVWEFSIGVWLLARGTTGRRTSTPLR